MSELESFKFSRPNRSRLATARSPDRSDQPILSAHSAEWSEFSLTHLTETDGELVVPPNHKQVLVVTREGAKTLDLTLDGQHSVAPVGQQALAAIPAGLEVRASWENHTPLQTVYVVEFDHSLFSRYAPELAVASLLEGCLRPSQYRPAPKLSQLVGLLAEELDENRRRGRLFAETLIRAMAIEVATEHWSANVAAKALVANRDPRISRAIDFIESNFSVDVSLTEIANAAGQSPTQLNLAFKAVFGISPYSWVINRRLTYAQDLLRKTNLPIAMIAVEAGFSDQAHFTRTCTTRLGRTPAQIRKG